ncbi:TerD family protein [Nocardioides lentus]|uniref:TerD family protein n=1 Tax=Nocardioides lentus TaxID=338077 RepID=A0ABP5ALS3_9ACTN
MIELQAGQALPLEHTRLRLGLGWDSEEGAGVISERKEVDLDVSAFQFAGTELFDLAFYNNLATRDGSTVHLGDNLTGDGKGDDEQVTVDLTKVYRTVDRIAVLVSSYQGHSLEWVGRAYCRVVAVGEDPGGADEVELGRLTISGGIRETGVVLAALERTAEGWSFRGVGRGVEARVPTESVRAVRRAL